jgi:hypothetical protein
MYWEYCVEDTAISSFLVTRFQVEGRYFPVTCHLELCDPHPLVPVEKRYSIFRQIHQIHTLGPKHHKGSSQPVLCGPRWPMIYVHVQGRSGAVSNVYMSKYIHTVRIHTHQTSTYSTSWWKTVHINMDLAGLFSTSHEGYSHLFRNVG